MTGNERLWDDRVLSWKQPGSESPVGETGTE